MATDHYQVQRRGMSLTLAELLVALLLVWFVGFAGGYWVSRNHSVNFHAGAYDKLETKHTRLLEDFAKLETRMGLLEGKGQKKGWRGP
jgi:hypothetical protein